jgi:hypothetical protein
MKKLSLYLTLALAGLFMGSCSDDYTDWAQPQSNPQEDAITIPGFTASAVEAQTLSDEVDSVKVFNLTTATLPDGFTLANARWTHSAGLDGAAPTTVNTSLAGLSSMSDIQSLIEVVCKNPVDRKFDAQVYVNAVKMARQCFSLPVNLYRHDVHLHLTMHWPFYSLTVFPKTGTSRHHLTMKSRTARLNVYDESCLQHTFPVADTTGPLVCHRRRQGLRRHCNDDLSQVFGTKRCTANKGTGVSFDRRANPQHAAVLVTARFQVQTWWRESIMMSYTYKVTAINTPE